jgi:cysteinyl-tRNA synthetase, unknown class
MRNAMCCLRTSVVLLLLSCGTDDGAGPGGTDTWYADQMRLFVQGISDYARTEHPDFIVVPQNGCELLTLDLEPDGPQAADYLAAIDGQGQEDLFFGYTGDDQPTPAAETEWMLSFLSQAESAGIEVMVTDYCWTEERVDSSYSWNQQQGFVSFAADRRSLDFIPPYPSEPWNLDYEPVNSLSEAGNFLYLINDQAFTSQEQFVGVLDNTGYDMFVIDLFCAGSMLPPAAISALQTKPGGARRLVLCYMSIGEAEDYRWYWQPEWSTNPPAWLGGENPSWPGNYLVQYWDPEWQAIIYGSDDSYLDRIMTAGFDGVYLDKVDSFESF